MSNFRCKKLLELAKEAPHCMNCGVSNWGQVVAAHSNSQKHGKGMGIKAHDIPSFLCERCHDLVDGRSGNLDRETRQTIWADSMISSFVWLLDSGRLRVK